MSSLWVSVSRWYLNSQRMQLHMHTHTHTHTCLHAPRHRHGQVSPVCSHTDTHEHTQIALNKCPPSGGRFLWKLIQVGRMRAGHLLLSSPLPLLLTPPPKSTSVVSATWTNKQLRVDKSGEKRCGNEDSPSCFFFVCLNYHK